MRRVLITGALGAWLAIASGLGEAAQGPAQTSPGMDAPVGTPGEGRSPGPASREEIRPPVPLVSGLDPEYRPIDLATALRLAQVENPELNVARQRVVESVALRQLAAVQILPTINGGTNYDTHTGVLQQSNGNILTVNRSAVYVGAGANAVAAGTVNIPGVLLSGNIAEGVFGWLVARQVVIEREAATIAQRNQTFLAVCLAYSELLRAEGRRAVGMQTRDEAARVYRLVAAYSKVGQAKPSDADRFATELARRQADVQQSEGDIQVASARLCELLNLDPSIRLHPTDAWVAPTQVVPPPVPLAELIAMALLRRPELAERRAVIREALLALEGAKALPFSPTVLIGFSGGAFGGGSNLVRPIFGGFGGRSDFDAVAYWSLRNMGVGNVALINAAKARARTTQFQELAMLNRVRAEVAESYARTHVRFAQIGTTEQAVRSSSKGFLEDLSRAEGAVGLPIEAADSLRLLASARYAYLDSIVDFNRAEFELYVAMGQPPADVLARPVPSAGVVPPGSPMPTATNPTGITLPRRGAGEPQPGPAAPPAPADRNGPFAAPNPGPVGR